MGQNQRLRAGRSTSIWNELSGGQHGRCGISPPRYVSRVSVGVEAVREDEYGSEATGDNIDEWKKDDRPGRREKDEVLIELIG